MLLGVDKPSTIFRPELIRHLVGFAVIIVFRVVSVMTTNSIDHLLLAKARKVIRRNKVILVDLGHFEAGSMLQSICRLFGTRFLGDVRTGCSASVVWRIVILGHIELGMVFYVCVKDFSEPIVEVVVVVTNSFVPDVDIAVSFRTVSCSVPLKQLNDDWVEEVLGVFACFSGCEMQNLPVLLFFNLIPSQVSLVPVTHANTNCQR